MPSFMKPAYAYRGRVGGDGIYDKQHPEYEKFKALVKKGCPKCQALMFVKGEFHNGIAVCSSVRSCCMEYEYDGEGKWKLGNDGKPGKFNDRFRPRDSKKDRQRKSR